MDKQMRDKLIKIIKKQSVCCNGNDCDKCCYDGDDCVEERLADAIIDSKAIIPEGAVVLTREEYERLLKEETLCERLGNDVDVKLKYIYELEDKVAQERKETAEKFAEMVSKAFIGLNCIDIDEWNWCQRKIDEICEEITGEGKDGK